MAAEKRPWVESWAGAWKRRARVGAVASEPRNDRWTSPSSSRLLFLVEDKIGDGVVTDGIRDAVVFCLCLSGLVVAVVG